MSKNIVILDIDGVIVAPCLAKVYRTGLAGKRAADVGTTRLATLGSPWGVPITHSELTSRLQEEAS